MTTPSQTVGPFYTIGLCRRNDGTLAAPTDPGSLELVGQLFDGQDAPVVDGMIEIWDGERWGRSGTDGEGRFAFRVSKPRARPGETPRFDVYVFARGLLQHELTRVYFPDEPNETDPVFAALDERQRRTVVAHAADGALRFDIHLQGENATVFFA